MLSTSPQALYSQRQNSGNVTCTLNPSLLPNKWAGSGVNIHIQHYDAESALTKPYLYMYQKGSEKAQSKQHVTQREIYNVFVLCRERSSLKCTVGNIEIRSEIISFMEREILN